MSHEARINDALKQLGEEFRLGMVQAEEYRARRRLLLESWGERDATTSPGSLRRAAATATQQNAVKAPAASGAAPRKGTSLAIVAVLAAMIGGAAFMLLRSPQPAEPARAVPAAPALPAPVQAAGKAADGFLAANTWDATAVEGFLAQWRGLSAEDRAIASQQPSLRTLRYQLAQNIDAESQLAGPDAAPEQRQRLQMLEDFARELGPQAP